MPLVRKPVGEISAADLDEACRDHAIEDEQLDFKQMIPHKDGEGRDPWRDAREIKPYGRDQLLASVVAFANSYGGDLVIGVRENGGKPGRAEQISALPACEDAAHRLLQAASELIEPPIPNLQSHCVLTEGDVGVLIIRVPRSRMAPHRLASDRNCYHRVRHETRAMTMRQIQDLTFAVARGLDAVDQRFAQLRESFRVWSSIDHAPANAKRMGIRVSCVPSSGECFLDRVHGIDVVKPRQRRATVEIKGQSFDLVVPFDVYNWRPLLRGTGAEETHNERKARIYLYCDGALTYEYVADVLATVDAGSMDSRVYRLYPGWLFGIIVNAIEAADRFRVEAGASAVDYAVEIEIASSHGLVVYRMGARSDFDKAGELPAGTHVYPRYVLSAKDSWSETLTLMWRDFWNSIGVPEGDDYLRLDHPS